MSDPGPRAWLRVLVEESSYISGSKKGSIGRCQWSELEPISRAGEATLYAVEQPVRPTTVVRL